MEINLDHSEKPCIIAVTLYLSATYALFFFVRQEALRSLLMDNRIVDWVGAICYLAASIGFFLSFIKDGDGNDFSFIRTKKNIFLLLFAIAFFIAFGEEINWLQRLFHIKTNGTLLEYNVEKETNFHNLKFFYKRSTDGGLVKNFYSIDMLFTLFWMTYGILLPIFSRYSRFVSNLIKRINLPMVPLWLSLLLLLNYLYYKFVVLSFPLIIELKEAHISLLFAILSIFLLMKKYSPKPS